ncbi:NADP-dependent oxidoreductase [Psychrobacillus psychrodurans]|uniref:NADP-dependent oxidoreductase n=1 Tax=Psychrobacillus psychrodurans TaxID=126157 RepID=UPI0008E0D66D|nr:NADP-dependent oxidoreductase [Psychrobacillus psychrodurans]MCZ8539824.1 NADP-dependent oxidoreductase [Psychrobacillus psychrodurans]SFM91963.1 NADPH:quinone reductase [Psychrobacillus psychrodurans]
MKAIAIKQYGGKEQLKEIDISKPTPKEKQVIVKLHATSINPIDWKLREGYLKAMMPFEFPIILGWDVAGMVEEVGEHVQDFKVGDRVFARPETTNRGTYSEYTIVDTHLLAKIPDNISFEEAACVPLACLTAWQCLFDFGNIQKGDKVLIHAGAGGVGTFAIQLAKNVGAYVAATAGKHNVDFLKSLGADEVIDYKKQDFEKVLTEFDFVLDSLGGENQEKSFTVLKEGGKLASIVSEPNQEKAKQKNIKSGNVWLVPNGQQLEKIANLLGQNKLRVIIGHKFPFSEEGIKEAHALSESHHAKGKIVIQIK